MGDNLFGEFFRSSTTSSNSARLQAICAMFTLIPILIFISNGPKVALATQEVTVYRMNHHDWLGNPYGSRSSLMNLEMRTAATLSRSYAKKCLLLKIDEIINSTENFEDFITNPMVGGMLIIIPDSFAKIGDEKRSKLLTLEKSLNSRSFDIPIYFVKEDANLIYMYQELSKESTDEAKTDQFIGADILNAITLDGYQLSISGPPPKPINEPIITNIETKLVGSKPDDQSTIVVVAHYDAFGISPGLSFGGDSNGSGVVALLELVRIFSKLYATRKVKPSFNLVFLLSGAGKFSYLGTKKWIEEHMDIKESGLLGDVQVSICLDSLGSLPDNSIYAHVPRIPKETTTTFKLFNHLSEIASKKDINATFVPKKTFLSDDLLNWEHDRFIQRRIPALTLSSLQNPKSLSRNSIIDTIDNVNIDVLTKNIEIIAETLYHLVFNNHHPDQSSNTFKDELGGGVSKQFINSMLKQITSSPRSQQMLLTTVTGSTYKVAPLMSNLFAVLKKFSKDTRYHHFKLDRKEPEVVFYEPTLLITNIYNIKPAILDLFLSLGIFSYLGILYLFLTNFETISTLSLSFPANLSRSPPPILSRSPLSPRSRRARSRRTPD